MLEGESDNLWKSLC